MELTSSKHQFTIQKEFKKAIVAIVVDKPDIAIIAATGAYITIQEFKEIFNYIGDLAKHKGITKLVFDKRNLTVFHQPSMEWYFIEWKEAMFEVGLRTHRKILPADKVFQQSVRIGRQTIAEKHPEGKYRQMDIEYADTLDDAIDH